MGRPRTEIDWQIVDEYLLAQCQGTEIADLLGIAADTLYRRCEEEFSMTFQPILNKRNLLEKQFCEKNNGKCLSMEIEQWPCG